MTGRAGRPWPTIFLSAGEPSGDLHGAGLAAALKRRFPNARLRGLGGPRMAAEGMELLADLEDLSVMGFVEVLRDLPFFLRLRRKIWLLLERERPDLVIPIDYPGWNLRLARHARGLAVPVLYYIAPQVWAWGRGRVAELARYADRLVVALPFEEPLFREAGAPVRFVGHPLLDLPDQGETRAGWAERNGLDPDRPILALYPGSRTQEIRRHEQLFSEAAARITEVIPAVQPALGGASDLPLGLLDDSRWPVLPGAGGLLRHATAALVKSGTTTLQAALAGTPHVVAYRTSALTHQIAKRVVQVPHIALTNLLSGRRVVPEFVQEAATPTALAAALLPLIDPTNPERRRMMDDLTRVRAQLGEPGVADRVAEIAAELLPSPA